MSTPVNAIIDRGWPSGAKWVGRMIQLLPLAKYLSGEELIKVRSGKDFLFSEFPTKTVLITRHGEISIKPKNGDGYGYGPA